MHSRIPISHKLSQSPHHLTAVDSGMEAAVTVLHQTDKCAADQESVFTAEFESTMIPVLLVNAILDREKH